MVRYSFDIERNAAKDIIVAKILEVSDDLVTYKDFNNQDGPTFSILRSKVSKIKFANGMEMNFSDDAGNIINPSQMTGPSISNENEDLVARAAECTSQAQFYALFREEQLKTIFSADEYALYRKFPESLSIR